MINSEEKIFNESFNYLLKEASFSTDNSNQISDKMVTKLFKAVNNKILKSDYTIIDKTKGDFLKIDNYSDLYNAEAFLYKMCQNISNKEIIEAVSEIQKTRNNLISFNTVFMKAYNEGNQLFTMIYKTISVSYIMTLSLLITDIISTFKDEYNIVQCVLKDDAKLDASLSYLPTLKDFNILVNSGEFTKISKNLNTKNVLGEALNVAITMDWIKDKTFNKLITSFGKSKIGNWLMKTVTKKKVKWSIAIIILLIIICKRGAYVFYSTRIRLSNYFKNISIMAEASSTQANNPETKRKQEKAASVLRKISDRLSVDSKVASKKGQELEDKDEKDIINDIAKEQKESNDNSNIDNSSSSNDEFF